MEKRRLSYILLIIFVLLIYTLNYQGYATRKINVGSIQTQSRNQAIYLQTTNCSQPSIINPMSTQYLSGPLIDGRFIVWTITENNGINITYYDLGPDERFGTSDDSGPFKVVSQNSWNIRPHIHDSLIIWIAGEVVPTATFPFQFKKINICLIPNCATSLPTTILNTSTITFNDADFYKNFVVYSESLPTSKVYLYDIHTSISRLIFSSGGVVDDVEIEGEYVAFSSTPSSNIFLYNIQKNMLNQITFNTNFGANFPRITYISPNHYILTYNQIVGVIIFQIIGIKIINNNIQPFFTINSGGFAVDAYYNSNKNIFEFSYVSVAAPAGGALYLMEINLTSNTQNITQVPTPLFVGFTPASIYGNNLVFRGEVLQGSSIVHKIAISECT